MFNQQRKQQTTPAPKINAEDLWGVYNESVKRRNRIEEQAVRKGLNLPSDDGMRDFTVNHPTPPPRERSPLELFLTASALAAAVAIPVGGMVMLPAILNAMKPNPSVVIPPAAPQSPPQTPPAAIPEIDIPEDTNDVFELRLRPPGE